MMLRTPLVAVALILLLAGCAIGKPIPEATTYAIEPPAPAPAPIASRRAETLRMGKVRVAPNFADRALVVRVDEVRYAADFYNSFIAPPGDMLGAVMADWLNDAGAFATVTHPGTRTPAAFVLEATVTKLYGDFRPGRTPSAVMEVQFSLVELSGISPTVRLEQTIGRSVPLSESTPEALVQGYGRALAEMLSELSLALTR
jgi:cholesterol transport system auxiliary component